MGINIDRRLTLAGIAASIVSACQQDSVDQPFGVSPPPPQPAPSAPQPAPSPPRVSSAVAVKWSDLATNAMLADTLAQPPGLSPMEQSRILAMAFLAGHNALNRIERIYPSYRIASSARYGADPAQTYEVAVCTVLRAMLPAHAQAFNQVLVASAIYPYGEEAELGGECANELLADRANDGSAAAQGPYTPGAQPGDYQLTPPVNAATFVNWGNVRPFALAAGSQFRAPPPLAINSPGYAADFREVKDLGAAVGSTRTTDQSEIARFWLESTPLTWQRILADQIRQTPDGISLWTTARLFALLQVSQADAYIASLDSKYYYNYWRPITAIRAAGTDGNADTVPDAAWQPFDPVTPPVPEYPSAHAAAGAAGVMIMSMLDLGGLNQTLTYTSSTGAAPRHFTSYFPEDRYDPIAEEIGLSRIYVGYHFRQAVYMGWSQGYDVGSWVAARTLLAG